MKRLFTRLCVMAGIMVSGTALAGNLWQQVDAARAPQKLQAMHPATFKVFTMDEATLKLQMWNLGEESADGMIISLPLPDGTYRDFTVWQTPMMPGVLANKYPDIRTFTAHAVGNQAITAKLDFTGYGFHAMIFDGGNTSFIDPYDNYHDGFYMVHYKKDEVKLLADRMHCEVKGDDESPAGEPMLTEESGLPKLAQKIVNGYKLRTYRIAISCSHQYAQAATGLAAPTIAQTFAKMTTSMNRINGVYNRDFSVQMNFVANEDTLIWTQETGTINGTDPFSTINSNGNSCLSQNQVTVTDRIGTANFDCGHVFTTGGGGISSLGVVCNDEAKAQSVTGLASPVGDGYDIDYVAHEMGHEFGSNHTFNDNNNGSCTGNAVRRCAYEPGSGATIMDYAGICAPDDLQPHSDPYFSISSLLQIQKALITDETCEVATSTGNLTVGLSPFTTTYTIPYKTPFELIAPTAVDSVADTAITYGWAEWDLGGNGTTGEFGLRLAQTFLKGPIFRSFNPDYVPVRVFPKLSMVLAGNLTSVTVENNMGEKAPDTARALKFKIAVRSILNGKGCFVVPDDSVTLNAVSTGAANDFGGFKVTSQGTTGIAYDAGSTQTITWNVVGTNAAPVNATTVGIYMSGDGGLTWPDTLGNFPNNGSALVTLPDHGTTSTAVRFKVKATGNVFFNVNLKNITVTSYAAAVSNVASKAAGISIYPVPAGNVLHISSLGRQQASLYNELGQQVWSGIIDGSASITVATWAKGVYYASFTDSATGTKTVKSFIID